MSWRRAKSVIALFLAILLIGAAVGFYVAPRSGVRESLQRIRAAGLPASAQELNQWYAAVPKNQNRALMLIDAANEAVAIPVGLDKSDEWTPEHASAVRDFLRSNDAALKKVHEAAALSLSRFPVDMSLGFATTLPHLANVKSLALLLKFEMVYHAHEKNTDAVLRSFRAALAVGDALRREPLLISGLVGIASLSMTLSALGEALGEVQFKTEQLLEMSTALAKVEADGLRSLNRGLVGERAAGISAFQSTFQQLEALSGNGGSAPSADGWLHVLGYQAYRATGMRERDLQLYLDFMESYLRATQGEFPSALENARNTRVEIQERSSSGLGRLAILTRMLIPALQNAIEKEAVFNARLRCALMALAVARFSNDHEGRLPESLDELIPAYLHKLPVDPFDGSALTYERLSETGFRIVSPKASTAGSKSGKDRPDVGITVGH